MESLFALGFVPSSRPFLLVHPERFLRLHLCKSAPRLVDGTESTAELEELVAQHPLGDRAAPCLLLLGAERSIIRDEPPREEDAFTAALRRALRELDGVLTSAGSFTAAQLYLERRRLARKTFPQKKHRRRAVATALKRMLSAAGASAACARLPNATSDVRGMTRALGPSEREVREKYADERRREEAAHLYHPQRMLAQGVFHAM